MYQLTGAVKVLKDREKISDRFTKQEIVITDTNAQYPQDILFQCANDKCALLDNVKEGDQVTVNFNLRGREWKNPKTGEIRYFNSLDIWKLEKAGAGGTEAPPSAPLPSEEPDFIASNEDDEDDDLPF